jgi:hypothetical protein
MRDATKDALPSYCCAFRALTTARKGTGMAGVVPMRNLKNKPVSRRHTPSLYGCH